MYTTNKTEAGENAIFWRKKFVFLWSPEVEDGSDPVGLQPEGESRETPGNNDCDVWLVDATVLDKAQVRSITQFFLLFWFSIAGCIFDHFFGGKV